MKPTALRLGNYVRIKDNGTIVKVEAISRKKVRFFYGDDKSRSYYRRYTEIEPVLICDHWQKINCSDLYWHEEYYEDGKWYGYCNCDKAIRYIHELQNLHYALMGEEIEIKL